MKPITQFLVNNPVNKVSNRYPTAESFEDLKTNDACYFKIDTHCQGSKSSILMGISVKPESDAYIDYKIAINKGLAIRVNYNFGNGKTNDEYLPLTTHDKELLEELEILYNKKFKSKKYTVGTVSGDSYTGWDIHLS